MRRRARRPTHERPSAANASEAGSGVVALSAANTYTGNTLIKGETFTLLGPALGEERPIERLNLDGDVAETVTGRFYPFDHLPGGLLIVPEGAAGGAIRFNGQLAQ